MDALAKRTAAKDAPKGWWRWNIKDPYSYAKRLAKQVERMEGRPMSPSRLREGIA